MKKYFSNIRTLAALLMAGAAFAACSSDNDITAEQPANPAGEKVYTLTVKASKGGASTRSLDFDGDNLVASWDESERIYVIKLSYPYSSLGYLQPTNISADGNSATLTGDITISDLNVGDNLALSYNYQDISLFKNQTGTLKGAYGAEGYDMATAEVTVASIDGNNITATTAANFETQTAMIKLTLKNGTTSINATSLNLTATMNVGGTPVTEDLITFTPEADIYSVNGNGILYFALPSAATFAGSLATKYSAEPYNLTISQSDVETLLASATITFTASDGVNTYVVDKTGYPFTAGKYYTSTLAMKKVVDLAAIDANYVAQDGELLTGSLTEKVKISIANNATVTLKDANVRCPDDTDELTNNGMNWAGITCEGNADIVLEGTNTARGFNYKYPGVYVPSGSTLTISGSGQLTADGPTGNYSCGIGGGFGLSSGNIVIQSGTIIANGGDSCAGIGGGGQTSGGSAVSCGYITISGGNVTATSRAYCPGIGAGCGSSNAATCGDITLSGGTITVSHGNSGGAAIGNAGYSNCSKVTITDGVQSLTVTNLKATSKVVSTFIDATAVYVGTTDITSDISLDVDNTTIQGYMTGLGFTSQSYDADAKTWSLAK